MKKIKKQWWIASLVLLCVVAFFIMWRSSSIKAEFFTVSQNNISETMEIRGKLLSENDTVIMPMVAGVVEKINVKQGQIVKKGDILLKLDTSSMEEALTTLNNTLSKSVSADITKKQQSAMTKVELAIALAQNAFVNKDSIEEALNGYKSQLKLGEAIAASGDINNSLAEINASESITNLQTQKETLEKEIASSTIVAPFDGIVASLNIDEGMPVMENTNACRIVNTEKQVVSAMVDERKIKLLNVGQKVVVDGVSGEITYKSDVLINQEGGTVVGEIKIMPFSKITQSIMSNVDISINTGEKQNVLCVPIGYIQTDESGSFVLIKSRGKAKKQYVKTGEQDTKFIEVVSGLAIGDKVINPLGQGIIDGVRVH